MTTNEQYEAVLAQVKEELDFDKLTEFCEHMTDAIQEVFRSCGLYFRLFSRVKTPESIAEKIIRRGYGTENNPKKLQDLVGIRVVLYYYDDMSICRDIVQSTFHMIDDWSRNSLSTNEFKATKINGVFQFPEEYFNLYRKNGWTLPIDTTFEMQFRTVFFEGWHEIEHDMRYKSFLSDEEFWHGSEELSRMLNCILANLELSDWSLVQLFDQLTFNHYKMGNWELMLKSKFRIHMDSNASLHPDIKAVFDEDRMIAKQFFKCSREDLIKELLTLDAPQPNYDLIVELLNNSTVHNDKITAVCKALPRVKEGHTRVKTSFARLDSSVMFHLELPLMHKETRTLESEFANAAYIIYKWARYKLNPVFEDMPADLTQYHNKLPGYSLNINYDTEAMTFDMKVNYVDSEHVGTLWHVCSSIALLDDGRLHFYHVTSRDMPHRASHQITFLKPSFISDLSGKVGLVDVIRIGKKAHFVTESNQFEEFADLVNNSSRTLPVIAIVQQKTDIARNKDIGFDEGYDMNTFTVNGTRLAKVTGQYSHVFLIDQSFASDIAARFGYEISEVYGGILVLWSNLSKRKPDFFTEEAVLNTKFDFNRFAFHDNNISEKAFRHKLVQMIKDDNLCH